MISQTNKKRFSDLSPARKAAVEFFYTTERSDPGWRWWAGYGRFFDPAIPSRIADPLMTSLHSALLDGDPAACQAAIDILARSHQKNQHAKGGPLIGVVTCVPTQDAVTAIQLLKAIATEGQ